MRFLTNPPEMCLLANSCTPRCMAPKQSSTSSSVKGSRWIVRSTRTTWSWSWFGMAFCWWINLWSSRWRNPIFHKFFKNIFLGGKPKKNTLRQQHPLGEVRLPSRLPSSWFSGRYFWGFHCEYCAEQSVLEARFFNSCLRYRYKSDQLNAKNTQLGGYMTKITYFNDRKLGGWRQNSETSVAGSKVKRGFNLGCHDMDGGT